MLLKRLFLGFFLGLIVGGGIAVGMTRGLAWPFAGPDGALYAYLSAALAGTLTGLIAGKPIWHQSGKIEAGLKAFFGSLLSLGLLFALRKFVHQSVDLSLLQGGSGPLGDLPYVALPAVSGVLGAFFELDNTPDEKETTKARVAIPSGKKQATDSLEEEAEVGKSAAKRKL
jgi:hypothetical protein